MRVVCFSNKITKEVRARLRGVLYSAVCRCHVKSNRAYKDYGARGIRVCMEWRKNREAFFHWAIAHGYESGLWLERIDNNGGYSPKNCKWATIAEQHRNKRSNKHINVNGEKTVVSVFERNACVGSGFVYLCRKRGLTDEQIITKAKEDHPWGGLVENKRKKIQAS